MIPMSPRWWRARFGMMKRQRADWCGTSIRLWPGWSVRIDRNAPLKRTFAK